MKRALISDIHEDIISLKLALRKIEKSGCDEIICLGDISGFSAPHYDYYNTRNASECLKIIRENCSIIIAGNHDLHAAKKTPEINPNFNYPINWYALDYHQRFEMSNGQLWLYENDELNPLYTNADKEFLKTLPEYHLLKTETQTIFLSHFVYPNLTGVECGFYGDASEFDSHREYMDEANCAFGFMGHRHFSGLLVASKERMLDKRYNSSYTPNKNDCIMVPPITGYRMGNGFCVFNDALNKVEAIRI